MLKSDVGRRLTSTMMGHCDAASTAPTQCAQGNPLPPLMNLPIAPCSDAKSYQFFRARIRCVPRLLGKLQEEVKRRRAMRGTWTQTAWKKEVAVMATMDWGTSTHGGRRKRAGNLLKHDKVSNLPATGGSARLRARHKISAEAYKGKCALFTSKTAAPDNSASAVAVVPDNSASVVAVVARNGVAKAVCPAPVLGGQRVSDSAKRVCVMTSAPGDGAPNPDPLSGVDLGYRILGPALGSGTFGDVYPALWKNGDTEAGGQFVVVKHVAIQRPHADIANNEAREVHICRQLHHHNAVKLLHAVQTPFALDLVFEHCDFDLRAAMKRGIDLGEGRSIIQQLCSGLSHVHNLGIVHRDLKPANILVQDMRGHGYVVKIADFGCARPLAASSESASSPPMTKKVTTLWYRAPEMLLGTARYGLAVDAWSLGCISVEILVKKIAFPGTCEFDMLVRIFRICGSPSKTLWFSLTRLPSFAASRFPPSTGVAPSHWQFDDGARAFVHELLTPCPLQRITAKDALGHMYLVPTKPTSGEVGMPASGGNARPASGGLAL